MRVSSVQSLSARVTSVVCSLTGQSYFFFTSGGKKCLVTVNCHICISPENVCHVNCGTIIYHTCNYAHAHRCCAELELEMELLCRACFAAATPQLRHTLVGSSSKAVQAVQLIFVDFVGHLCDGEVTFNKF